MLGSLSGAGALFGALWARERHRRLVIARDMESQFTALTQLERRASVGGLMTAITHELGQPIATILRNAEAARMILETDHRASQTLKDIVDDILKSDKYAHELIQRLRAALRNHPVEFHPVDLAQVVEDAIGLAALLASERGATVILIDNGAGPWTVCGDAVHLGQVMLNLLLNSIEAVCPVPRTARRITVSLSSRGDHVCVDIEDSGPGFSADALDRAFDPFFTTKPEGMGMGLSIARHIVQRHGGRIIAANREDGGAIVSVRLPRCEGREDDHGIPVYRAASPSDPYRR